MKRPDLHLCIDRVVPMEHKPVAAELARKENRRNIPDLKTLPGVSISPSKIALFTGKMWQDGKTLGVAFLDGDKFQRDKVIEKAKEWTKYANIKFNFNAGKNAQIRISFQADPGSWSAVGTDCLLTQAFKKDEPTMNFGWLTDSTDDTEYRRVVVHEFGHALGAIHEHQNPKGGIKWNLPAVYAYFSGPPNNWSKDEIDHNVVQKYSMDQLNATKFDIHSIMLYSFPAQLVIGGKGTPENTDLSKGDKSFIRKMYPKKK